MSTPPTPESMDRGGKGKTAIPEEKEDEPSLLPMTPESKQLAAVIATADSSRDRHGWKISLDRGLDIFQWFESSAFNAATNLQEARLTKGCEVSFIRVDQE